MPRARASTNASATRPSIAVPVVPRPDRIGQQAVDPHLHAGALAQPASRSAGALGAVRPAMRLGRLGVVKAGHQAVRVPAEREALARAGQHDPPHRHAEATLVLREADHRRDGGARDEAQVGDRRRQAEAPDPPADPAGVQPDPSASRCRSGSSVRASWRPAR